MFLRLRHPAVVRRDDKESKIDRADARDHVAHKIFVPGNVNHADRKTGQCEMREPEIDRDSAPASSFSAGKTICSTVGVSRSGRPAGRGRRSARRRHAPHARAVCVLAGEAATMANAQTLGASRPPSVQRAGHKIVRLFLFVFDMYNSAPSRSPSTHAAAPTHRFQEDRPDAAYNIIILFFFLLLLPRCLSSSGECPRSAILLVGN